MQNSTSIEFIESIPDVFSTHTSVRDLKDFVRRYASFVMTDEPFNTPTNVKVAWDRVVMNTPEFRDDLIYYHAIEDQKGSCSFCDSNVRVHLKTATCNKCGLVTEKIHC